MKISQLEIQLDQVNNDYARQQEQTLLAEQKINRLTEENQLSRQAHQEKEQALRQESAEYQAQIERLEALLAGARQQQQESALQLETQERLNQILQEQLAQSQADLAQHIQSAEQTLDVLRQEQITALEAQRAQMQTQIDHLLAEQQKLSQEIEDLYASIDHDIQIRTQDLQQKNQELLANQRQLQAENEGLRRQLFLNRPETNSTRFSVRNYPDSNGSNPASAVILASTEIDLYPEERKSLILDILRSQRNQMEKQKRRIDIIDDILVHNSAHPAREELEAQLKTALSAYREMDTKTRAELIRLGFTVTDDGKHCKLVFREDNRYSFACPKSGSDHRGGKNLFSWIRGKIL
ncbi:MAG: hypothetical protein ACK5CA_16355 [Cyanobacteriota bacterium]